MPSPPFTELGSSGGGGEGRRPVDINVMKRNMTIAKGFLDISLLSANANQLRNVVIFGNEDTTVHYLILTGIILSLILQVSAGVVLIVAERFDINREDEQDRGDLMNTVVVSLIFVVLIINVFVAGLGVDVVNPHHHDLHPPDYPGASKDVLKGHLG